jgi:hypothetical protein
VIDSDSTNRQHIDDVEPTDFDLVQEEFDESEQEPEEPINDFKHEEICDTKEKIEEKLAK